MKNIKINKQNSDPQEQALNEVMRKAREEGVDVNVVFFDPDEEVIIKKATLYILVSAGIIVGYIGAALVL